MRDEPVRPQSDTDRYKLDRFLVAQTPIFQTALDELRTGRKRSHWMWFVFPQLSGVGHSATAVHYGISGLVEACAYLAHPEPGPRLRACTQAVIESAAPSLDVLFGSPDDLKFISSMTLFDIAEDSETSLFRLALARWTGGERDPKTLALL